MAGPSREGEILDGKYRILRKLGEGGMGAVYAGEHVRLKKAVAIKLLHAGANVHAEMADRFEREAQAAGQIGSDHIVEVFDIGATATGDRFMVMEYLEGEPLRTRIRRLRRMREVEVAELARQLLEGLGAAHRAGIVHRDLKPDNVFICREKAGRRDFVKVLDFGISKFSQAGEAGSMTKTGTIMGSPNYMSPEHVQASHEVDARSDLYSVGVVLFEAVTGRIPRKAATFAEILFKVVYEPVPDPRTVEPDVDPDFAVIVAKACAHRKDLRYQSAEEFKTALEVYLASKRASFPDAGASTIALPPGALAPPAPPSHPGMGAPPPAGFGSASQPSFGASSQPAFVPSSQPSFGASSQPQLAQSQPSYGSWPSAQQGVPPAPVSGPFAPSGAFSASSPSFAGPAPSGAAGAISQPAFGSGSQPSFDGGHGAAALSGSQPSFASGSQPSYASQFSVTHQPPGEVPGPKRKLIVALAVAGTAATGMVIAVVLALRSPAGPPSTASTSKPAATSASSADAKPAPSPSPELPATGTTDPAPSATEAPTASAASNAAPPPTPSTTPKTGSGTKTGGGKAGGGKTGKGEPDSGIKAGY